MSGTTAAPDCGLLHPVAVPAAIEASAPVLWPLHLRLVFERMVQPESATFGAPLKVSDVSAAGCPVPSVRMQEVSAWLPPAALPLDADRDLMDAGDADEGRRHRGRGGADIGALRVLREAGAGGALVGGLEHVRRGRRPGLARVLGAGEDGRIDRHLKLGTLRDRARVVDGSAGHEGDRNEGEGEDLRDRAAPVVSNPGKKLSEHRPGLSMENSMSLAATAQINVAI